MAMPIKPLEREKYGMLTPLTFLTRQGWLCRCDCGKEVVVCSNKMRNGSVLSCGCWRRENGYRQLDKARAANERAKATGQAWGWGRMWALRRGDTRYARPSFMSRKGTPCWVCRVPTRNGMVCLACAGGAQAHA